MSAGFIYILINPSMPKLLKIGLTSKTPEERAAELSRTTGVPAAYCVAYEEQLDGFLSAAESEIHRRLAGARLNRGREFFQLPLKDAIKVVAEIAASYREKSRSHLADAKPSSPDGWHTLVENVAFTTKDSQNQPHQSQASESADILRVRSTPQPRVSRLRPTIKLVECATTQCPTCGEAYSVTLRRYEDQSSCPRCLRAHQVAIVW